MQVEVLSCSVVPALRLQDFPNHLLVLALVFGLGNDFVSTPAAGFTTSHLDLRQTLNLFYTNLLVSLIACCASHKAGPQQMESYATVKEMKEDLCLLIWKILQAIQFTESKLWSKVYNMNYLLNIKEQYNLFLLFHIDIYKCL